MITAEQKHHIGVSADEVALVRTTDRTITDVRTLGRRRWRKEAGYPLQARVENAFFRYKSIIGDRLRALWVANS